MKVDHIGIAVNDLASSKILYQKLFPECEFEEIEEPYQGQRMILIHGENIKIELISPVTKDSAVGKFIERNGEGFHHIAYHVDDIRAKMAELKEKGLRLMTEQPYPGAEGFDICFLHPGNTNKVLIELCRSD